MASASTGQPVAAASAVDGVGAAPLAPPARITPAGRSSSATTSSATAGAPAARPRPVDRTARRQRAGLPDERLAERQVEVHRAGRPAASNARRASERHVAAPAVVGHAGIVEPAHGRPVQPGLVDRLRRADVAQLGRPVGRHDEHRARRTARPRRRPAGSWPPPCRSCTAAPPARPAKPDAEGDERRRPARRGRRARPVRRAPSSASAIGVLRDPGATTAWRTPRRDPLVDERGAERRLGVAAGHIGRDDTAVGWMPCSSRSGPTSCARGATSASGASPPPSPSSTTTPSSTSRRDRVPAVPARPAARRSASPRRCVDAYARKFGGPERAAADHRPTSRRWPPPRASSSTSTGPCGPTPRDAHRLLWLAAVEGPPGAQADAQGAAARRLLHRRRRRRRPRRARRGRPPRPGSIAAPSRRPARR